MAPLLPLVCLVRLVLLLVPPLRVRLVLLLVLLLMSLWVPLPSLGLSLREVSVDCGVDVLSFGGTKNGASCAEAVVFMNEELASDFALRRKRFGPDVAMDHAVDRDRNAVLQLCASG